ncbi:hypothetical protein PR048_030047 [Dryococelus australis]|uniref:Uncharacterized protein n=1 Tax=Dryococelus australis TaxID=614101 RepID=A0ABQ9G7V0_9NEOP|nr:hypothetical protein PR048_030047 [Dryococelus australis]
MSCSRLHRRGRAGEAAILLHCWEFWWQLGGACSLPPSERTVWSDAPRAVPLRTVACIGRRGSKTPLRRAHDVATFKSSDVQEATMVVERLACSPPTMAIRVQRIFACGNRALRRRWSAGLFGISLSPRPFIPALFRTHLSHPHRLSRPRCEEPSESLPPFSIKVVTVRGAAVAEWLDCSPPTKANRRGTHPSDHVRSIPEKACEGYLIINRVKHPYCGSVVLQFESLASIRGWPVHKTMQAFARQPIVERETISRCPRIGRVKSTCGMKLKTLLSSAESGGNGRSPIKSADQRHRLTLFPHAIEPGSLWWEASRLTAQPPRPLDVSSMNMLRVPIHAALGEHSTPVQSPARRGDGALIGRASVTLIAPSLLGRKRKKRGTHIRHLGGPGPAADVTPRCTMHARRSLVSCCRNMVDAWFLVRGSHRCRDPFLDVEVQHLSMEHCTQLYIVKPTSRGAVGWWATDLGRGRPRARISGKA